MGTNNYRVRIIGGLFRSRKVNFAGNPAIRPTPDRIREVLFNWLQADIAGARCLELYAGSGVLSLEALSRGAAHVTLLDSDPSTVKHLEEIFSSFLGSNAEDVVEDATGDAVNVKMKIGGYTLVNDEARAWLGKLNEASGSSQQFDLILLDPPFDSGELEKTLGAIQQSGIAGGLVYVETQSPLEEVISADWLVHRSSRAGKVHFGLLKAKHWGNNV